MKAINASLELAGEEQTELVNELAAESKVYVQNVRTRFNQLIETRAIIPHLHPVLELHTGKTVGFELLARSDVQSLETPQKMFAAAEYLRRGVELSELCRSVGYEVDSYLPQGAKLFVNVHPQESLLTGLLPSLRHMRKQVPDRVIVVEIHEAAVTDHETLNLFSAAVRDLNVQIAFDDFGVGRARLLELANVPPDFVKFDLTLVRSIDEQPRHHLVVLRHLVEMMREIGCTTIAEGVETERDAENCRRFGFELAQGFLYGRPTPIAIPKKSNKS
ncbi:MAG: EAL domain-containing protein [Pirellulaceae bacterium]